MSHSFRNDARKSLEFARKELATSDNERLRHAALELRMCVEAITYDRAEAYKAELPSEEYETWQPAKLLHALLAIDPTANSTKTIAFGKEDVPGEPAKEMQVLGTDKPLTLKVIKHHYDALGNFLHVPTLKQIQSGSVTLPEKVRRRCEALVAELDAALQSTVFNFTVGQFSHIDCMRCEKPIKRRLPDGFSELETSCIHCRAPYLLREKDGETQWIALQQFVPCPKCSENMKVWRDEIVNGASFKCGHCETALKVGLAFYVDDAPLSA